MDTQVDMQEKDLVEQAKTDEAAFSVLYERFFPQIFGYIYKRVGHMQVTEDIVSSTFLKAFAALPKYDSTYVPFSAWLYRIATNNLIDHYRYVGKYKEVDIENVPDIADEASGPEEKAARHMDRKQLEMIIQMLPENYQQVIQLKYFGDFSNKEIAEILGYTDSNVGVLLYRALQKAHQLYTTHVGQ